MEDFLYKTAMTQNNQTHIHRITEEYTQSNNNNVCNNYHKVTFLLQKKRKYVLSK